MTQQALVWIADDDQSIRWVLEKAMHKAGFSARGFADADALWRALALERPNLIISDIRMPNTTGLDLLARLRTEHPEIPVIIMTAHSDLESAVAAYQGGAFDYLPKPFDIAEAIALVVRACRQQPQKTIQASEMEDFEEESGMIGEAPAMQEVFRAIGRLSQSHMTVLIHGASGTGKELVAQALHKHSPRTNEPFIALNMAAIPKDLMEAELFGHEKGAFTGATNLRRGRFEQANNGTLFLDEIGDMPAETQTRLLRVLADGEFFRVGGHTPIRVDVRIIAATHQDLERLVQAGQFREDLFHRLNVIRIHIPPLSERLEDIPALTRYFLQRTAQELQVEPKVLTSDTQAYLKELAWPGNIRQLENTCRWITVMAAGREVYIADLPAELLSQKLGQAPEKDWEQALRIWVQAALVRGEQNILEKALPIFERILLQETLEHSGGRRGDAALLLGWGRNTLARKLKELDITIDDDHDLADPSV